MIKKNSYFFGSILFFKTYFLNVDKLEYGKTHFMCHLIFKWLCYGEGDKYVKTHREKKKTRKSMNFFWLYRFFNKGHVVHSFRTDPFRGNIEVWISWNLFYLLIVYVHIFNNNPLPPYANICKMSQNFWKVEKQMIFYVIKKVGSKLVNENGWWSWSQLLQASEIAKEFGEVGVKMGQWMNMGK